MHTRNLKLSYRLIRAHHKPKYVLLQNAKTSRCYSPLLSTLNCNRSKVIRLFVSVVGTRRGWIPIPIHGPLAGIIINESISWRCHRQWQGLVPFSVHLICDLFSYSNAERVRHHNPFVKWKVNVITRNRNSKKSHCQLLFLPKPYCQRKRQLLNTKNARNGGIIVSSLPCPSGLTIL
jgi:hypothetical protein